MIRVLLLFLALAAAAFGDVATLFEGGSGGYKLYRIPGIVVTKSGAILVYCEARRRTGGDWDTIDLLVRRSTDKGATFSEPQVAGHLMTAAVQRNPVAIERQQGQPDDVTYNNPVAIAGRNGSVHFLFCLEYMRVFYMRSDDDGRTFSAPREITSALESFRPGYAWRVVATGPGHGIQLRSGRLLVPIWLALSTKDAHGPSVNATLYSDDRGATWHHGDIAIPDTAEFPSANETALVELAGGGVMLNARAPSPRNRRVVAISKDGATHWSEPHFQEDLPDPICAAGLIRFSKRVILFSNPDNVSRADGRDQIAKDRRNLTVRLSRDEGRTWTVKRTLEPGPSAYSDLAVLPDHTILCFYESPGKLKLARFPLAWLNGKD